VIYSIIDNIMATGSRNLVRLNKSHAKSAIEVLIRAFRNYLLFQYYFPDELKRQKIAPRFLSVPVFIGLQCGEIYATSPNMEGVAIWIPSDNYRVTFCKLIRSVPLSVIFGLGRYGSFKMRQCGEHLDAVHQRLAPFKHWFLQTIGVDPQFQGKGYASKLLKPMLVRIDEEGLPCYLETLDEKNVPLYEHFGFNVIDKSNVPEADLTNWAMLREAQ